MQIQWLCDVNYISGIEIGALFHSVKISGMLKQRGCSYTIVVFFQMIMCMLKINKIVNTSHLTKVPLLPFSDSHIPIVVETTVEPSSSLTFKV